MSAPPAAPAAEEPRASGYGRGAKILSVGIATTGVVTFAYFSLASHALSEVDFTALSGAEANGEK